MASPRRVSGSADDPVLQQIVRVSIGGISLQFRATGVAEALEDFQLLAPHRCVNLVDRSIRLRLVVRSNHLVADNSEAQAEVGRILRLELRKKRKLIER